MSEQEPLSIIITGNPIDGFEVIGPFHSREETMQAGEELDVEWWVTTLEDPVKVFGLEPKSD